MYRWVRLVVVVSMAVVSAAFLLSAGAAPGPRDAYACGAVMTGLGDWC